MSEEEKAICTELGKLGINYELKRHEAVLTCEAHETALPNTGALLAKNLLIKKKKNLYLIVTSASTKVPLKAIGTALGIGTSVRMARPENMLEVLKAGPGSVNPLSVLFDTNNTVTVAFDKPIMEAGMVGVHPGTNDATVLLTPADLQKFVEAHGKLQLVDLSAIPAGGGGGGGGGGKAKAKGGQKKKKKGGQERGSKQGKGSGDADDKKMTRKKEGPVDNFGMWYAELVKKGELCSQTDISGCYVLRPSAFFMWEEVKTFMDRRIKAMGIQGVYFPLFIPKAALYKEADHVEGFTPEVAWVTHSGETELAQPVAVRPTSETVMYPIFTKWIQSYADLPLRVNQWCNVVRWEFKNPTPFLRTREFLWQEGHTVFETKDEALKEVFEILDLYADTYREVLAVPTIKGRKTENEKFPGGDMTTTVEAYIPISGRGIQGATSHYLGQNFGKMFETKFQGRDGKNHIPHQNSWGFTTRAIGVMLMNHSDNKGVVMPPTVAMIQVVVVPICYKEDDASATVGKAKDLAAELTRAGLRVKLDDRQGKSPGWKYAEWELKGVPVRVELGPKDLQNQTVRIVRRDTGGKTDVAWTDMKKEVIKTCEAIHSNLYDRAKRNMDDNIVRATTWDEFIGALEEGKLVLAPSCNESESEDRVGDRTKAHFDDADLDARALSGKAKALCIPLESERDHQGKLYQDSVDGLKCIESGKPATKWILWGRSY